jgi:hypothetical protein
VTEAEFQAQVIEIAKFRGWMVMHQRPAQMASGRWITAVQGDVGFPDLVLARPVAGDVIFAELKKEGGRVSPKQKLWIRTLMLAGAEAYIWYPSDLTEIITRLSRSMT